MEHLRPPRKKIFIGSSVEGLSVATALQTHFEHETTLRAYAWSNANFILSQSTLGSLQTFLRDYYYGIFVLTPDDKVDKRGISLPAPRDNVLFELGLFLGNSGPERTFIVSPRGIDIHIPTDLRGITRAEYEHSDSDEELTNNLGNAARQIKIAINGHEKNKKRRAKDKLLHHSKEIHSLLIETTDDRDKVNIVLNGLDSLIQEKASLMDQTVHEVLEDIILWTSGILDVLDPDQLALAQSANLKEVLVYAPTPLETKLEHRKLRDTVLKNLLAGVPYTYFIDSEDKINTILRLIDVMVTENSLEPEHKERILRRITVVVLQPDKFMTFYTVHKIKVGTKYRDIVFQSVIKRNRMDILTRLDENQARHVAALIRKHITSTTKTKEMGISVCR